jgi:hypothetical protein
MLVVMLIVVIVVVVVVLLLSAWIGVGVVGYELLEEGDNRAMHQHQRHWDGAPRPVGTSVSARGKDYRSGDRVSPAHWTLAIMPGTPSSITRKGTALVTRCFRDMQRTYDKLRSILLCGHDVQASRCSFRRASRGNWLVQSIWGIAVTMGNRVRYCVIGSMVNLRLIFINIHSFPSPGFACATLSLRLPSVLYELQRSYPPFIPV